jgi:tetratricopeptide (TPR) repeat protein
MTNPAYRIALEAYFAGDSRSLERFVHDRENSSCEINLIRARQSLRKGRYDLALGILNTIVPNTDFTRGEVAILKASVHSYFSRWQRAIGEALLARDAYAACHDDRGQFNANYNLSVYYGRLGLDHASNRFIDHSEKFVVSASQRSLVHRARACSLVRESKFEMAIAEIDRALALRYHVDPVDLAALLNVAADVLFRAEQFERAIQCLEEISQSKAIRDKARMKFDLLVMRALTKNERRLVPTACPEWIRTNEEYFLRWEVLSSLQSGETHRAELAWGKLVELFPLRFRPGFETVKEADEKMLFMKALRSVMRTPRVVESEDLQITGKAKELFYLLQRAKAPLRKEELIEKLWACPYEPSLDNRFYKVMGRLRKQKGVKVEVILNAYRLAQ